MTFKTYLGAAFPGVAAIVGLLATPSCESTVDGAASRSAAKCDSTSACADAGHGLRHALPLVDAGSRPPDDPGPAGTCDGDPCGKGHGVCCAGTYCAGSDFYQCFRATRDANLCQQSAVGNCYPSGTIACDPTNLALVGCPSNFVFGMAASTMDVCCAPLGNAGAFACTSPLETTYCETHNGQGAGGATSADAAAGPAPEPRDDGTCAVPCPGICAAGRCRVTLATTAATAFTIDGTSLYWTSVGDGTVMKMPLAGGPPTTLVSAQRAPDDIAVDGTNVYFANVMTYPRFDDGTIIKLPLAGGSPITLASAPVSPVLLAVDAENVYWTGFTPDTLGDPVRGSGTVMKVPVAGGPIVTLASGLGEALGIAVSGTNVYWTSPDGIMTVPITGGSPKVLATGNGPSRVAVDATNIYWGGANVGGQTLDGVWKMDLAGASKVTLASWDVGSAPSAILLDTDSVYFGGGAAPQGTASLVKVPLSGGSPVTLVANQNATGGLAVDATSAYWATEDAIMKVTPK